MPSTRDQISEVRSVADVAVKQIWLDDTFVKGIVHKVSSGVLNCLNGRFEQFDTKLDSLQESLTIIKNNYKQEIAVLNNKVNELEKELGDATGNSQDVVPNFNINNLQISCLGKNLGDRPRPVTMVLPNHNGVVSLLKDLLQKARQIKQVQNEASGISETHSIAKPKPPKCNFCHYRGHIGEECCKRVAKVDTKSTPTPSQPSKAQENRQPSSSSISCYSCEKAGFFRSNCSNCFHKKTYVSAQAVHFYAVNTCLIHFTTQVPTVPVTICGIEGYAHIDTAAKTSVVGSSVYEHLKDTSSCILKKTLAEVTLADGRGQPREVYTTNTKVKIGGRTFTIDFVILSDAEDNRTLLGVDFLEEAAMILNLPQRCWLFADSPVQFELVNFASLMLYLEINMQCSL
ncbi:unnamed protein product [Phaedon cochleariae]|uniref:Uncharacterized protein n=1 Tax=Phaedon cochleariae TaxID=80249 RepID=A0A9N9X3H5_PHACE|nr:unnamed protein product [Phaedon cochleariae]